MHPMKAAWLPLLLVATVLAGCSGGSSGCGDFCIDAPTDGGKTYGFRAGVTADNYTWDFGDNLRGYGPEVTHTYDVANAKLTVRLFAKTGTETIRYEKKDAIVFGSGVNQPATFLLEGATKWFVVNEPARFSASASIDPDGDVLRFSWACNRTGDAIPKEPHVDPVAPYSPPQAGSVTSQIANRTLPEPNLVLDPAKDMCEQLGDLGSRPMSTTATTIEGRFLRTGIYKIFLLAADPAHPAVSGEITVVVSETRPAPKATWVFQGRFNASNPGSPVPVQDACDVAAPGRTCDLWQRAWEMPTVGALESWVNFTIEQPVAPGVNKARWEWQSASGQVLVSGGEGSTHVDNTHTTLARAYLMVVKAEQGANFGFTLTVESKMDLDANKLWF